MVSVIERGISPNVAVTLDRKNGDRPKTFPNGSEVNLFDLKVNPLGDYLREIKKIPLLTKEEEIMFSKSVWDGKEAKSLLERLDNSTQPITEEIRLSLFKRIEGAEESRNKLVEANLRLVVKAAKEYTGKGLGTWDLIQEGNQGLIRAADEFDWRRGFRFSTYAFWCIGRSIARAITDQAGGIRIPGSQLLTLKKISKAREEIRNQGQAATNGEIAEITGIKQENIYVLDRARQILSLEKNLGDGNLTGEDTLRDEGASMEETEGRIWTKQLKQQLLEMMKKAGLKDRAERVLAERYGLKDGKPKTLEEVGKKFRVTKERIRQIEKEALGKLRAVLASEGKTIADFL